MIEQNRCYSYLSQMQNGTNCCDMSLYIVLFGVGWVMQGWGGVGHVGWGGVGKMMPIAVMSLYIVLFGVGVSCRGGVGHVGVGWGGSCRGGVDHVGVGWIMQGWGGSCRGVCHSRVNG